MRNTSKFWHCDFQQNMSSHIIIINAAFQFHEVHIFKKTRGENRFGVSPESASEDETTVAESLSACAAKKGGSIRMTCLA